MFMVVFTTQLWPILIVRVWVTVTIRVEVLWPKPNTRKLRVLYVTSIVGSLYHSMVIME